MPHDIHDINTPFYGIISMTASLYSLSFQLSAITPMTLSKISADIGYNQLQCNDLCSPPPVKKHFLPRLDLI
jgi:hypothetical protein